MLCVFLALHYLLFIFERQKVKLRLMRAFQAQLRPINQLLRQQALQVSLRSFHMQTHIGRDGEQVLKVWCLGLSIDKVPPAAGTHILNCTVLRFYRWLWSTEREVCPGLVCELMQFCLIWRFVSLKANMSIKQLSNVSQKNVISSCWR